METRTLVAVENVRDISMNKSAFLPSSTNNGKLEIRGIRNDAKTASTIGSIGYTHSIIQVTIVLSACF